MDLLFTPAMRRLPLLAAIALVIGIGCDRASAQNLVLGAEQSTGGVMIHLADGTPAVTLDATCKGHGSKEPAIEWNTPAPLPAGWWHGQLLLCPREGDERSWVNTHLGIAFDTPQKPMVNMMTNLAFDDKKHEAQTFDFWVYLSAPAAGVRIESVYDELYRYKRMWPIIRLTLEHKEHPAELGPHDPVTLDLTVNPDGSVPIPDGLPAGIWSLRAPMTAQGSFTCAQADGRPIEAPFAFDRWKRPQTSHLFLDSGLRSLRFTTNSMFHWVVLDHLATRPPGTPIPNEGELVQTVDPSRQQSAQLVLIGSDLPPSPPTFPLVPHGKQMVVMTTWDDGAPTDERCAEILHRHGYRPTFFINGNSPAMKFLDKLEAAGAEVGAHGYHHPSLYELPPAEAAQECSSIRKILESTLKHPVISFAYPNGYFPAYDAAGDYVVRAVRDAGYWSGRTTVADEQTVLTSGDLLTLRSDGFFGNAKDLERVWQQVRSTDGAVFYFWGHSWQIGKTDEQWSKFESFVAQFAQQPNAWYATQGEYSLWLWARKNVEIHVDSAAHDRLTLTLTRPWLHPYLASRCPMTLRVPPGTTRVLWKGAEVPVKDGQVELTWTD